VINEFVMTSDLDGTSLEISQGYVAPRFESIRVACENLKNSVTFYERSLHFMHDEPTEYSVVCEGKVIEDGRATRVYLPGQREKSWLSLTETSGASAIPARKSNTAGLYRMAILVDDIQAARADLEKSLPTVERQHRIYLGEQFNFVDAIFFRDPDGSVLEYLVGPQVHSK